jgi:prepilin-type N-terminal cleavage/methylation domain-containing protein
MALQLKRAPRGFTLIEMSVVLLIVMLLLGSLLVPLATQVEQRQAAETQKLLQDAKEALIGYAMVNGRLPRPAVSATNGAEKGTACADAMQCTGFLPWVTLGLPGTDAWADRLRYSVHVQYTSTITFTTPTASLKTVKTRDSAGNVVTLAVDVPAVVLSHGANNFGFRDDGLERADSSSTNADEGTNDLAFKCTVATNCDDDFISRTPSNNTAGTGGEFDDALVWIPTGMLFNRLVAAGRLP